MAKSFIEPANGRKQMNENENLSCALPLPNDYWQTILWSKVILKENRLQNRIAKAVKEKRWAKAKALMFFLTKSFYAKLLAVFRVTKNKGGKTPGVDRIVWCHPIDKLKAALNLKTRGYQTKPLRRIYIPKKNGKKRPLSIPVMHDRAMQTLYKMALEPMAEVLADGNSFGFRARRSCNDAIAQCFKSLCRKISAQWIFEADIIRQLADIRYADDFVITAIDKEIITNEIIPLVTAFLSKRGLELAPEKSKITNINDGFNFLSQNVRKYKGKLLIRPAKESVQSFKNKIKKIIRKKRGIPAHALIRILNPVIRGCSNYYKGICSKQTFARLGTFIYWQLKRWAILRHRSANQYQHGNKNRWWIYHRYFHNNHFTDTRRTKKGTQVNRLYRIGYVPIRYHVKVKASANPFLPEYDKYFYQRTQWRKDIAIECKQITTFMSSKK